MSAIFDPEDLFLKSMPEWEIFEPAVMSSYLSGYAVIFSLNSSYLTSLNFLDKIVQPFLFGLLIYMISLIISYTIATDKSENKRIAKRASYYTIGGASGLFFFSALEIIIAPI